MNFPSALSVVLSGTPVVRRATGVYVYRITVDKLPIGYSVANRDMLVCVSAQTNKVEEYTPTQGDIFADDWEVTGWTQN